VTLAMASVLAIAFGTAGGAVQDEENAADGYRRAASQLREALDEEAIESVAAILESGDVSDEQRALLEKAQPALATLGEAARLKRVDWGLDLSKGPEAEMPWLEDIRPLVQVAAADAVAKAGEIGRAHV